MKPLVLFFIVAIIGISSCFANTKKSHRIKQNINREWNFILKDVDGAEKPDFDDSDWQSINLPHSFSIPYFLSKNVYHGYGWYRKYVHIPSDWHDKKVTIEFEGVFIEAEVFVNGTHVGKHVGGYTGFFFDITKNLSIGQNVISVRVNNIWKPDVAPRAGDHQFSGGIYRDVYLNITDKLNVDVYGTFITTPVVNSNSAVCNLETEIQNNYAEDKTYTLRNEIKSPEGNVIAKVESIQTIATTEKQIVKQTISEISNPKLWSPESPDLYKAITSIFLDGEVVDTYVTTFGIRKFTWTANKGFFLNDNHYFLRGTNVHQDQAGWGDAVTNKAIRRDVQMIKDAGFNCIRASHYPHDPNFSRACDEIGIILFQENAFWGMGGSSGDQGWGGNGPSSSCYPVNPANWEKFNQSVLTQLKEMIKIHRNSASIAAWSLCNEPFFTDKSTDTAMKKLLNAATDSSRTWDSSRNVAIGGAQRKWVDRLGKNQIAFYNGDGASRKEFQNPGFPNLVSEYGSTTAFRPGQFFAGWGDIERSPIESKNPWNPPAWRSGQIIWCGFDHGTIGGVRLATMGLVDYFRLPKRQYYWYVEAYKNNNRNPNELEWPKEGVPAKLKLESSSSVISEIDGTDDVQLIVTVLNAQGKHISNNVPVELSIVSGPGQFPTGRHIQFMPPSKDESSDITVRDGQCAIAFRSYYAGKTIIKASSEGLVDAFIEIKTIGDIKWRNGKSIQVSDRPYKRFSEITEFKNNTEMLLASNRPSWCSSSQQGTNKSNANDTDPLTTWKADDEDKEKWWLLHLEASYCIKRIQLLFPSKSNQYQYKIETSADNIHWKEIVVDNSKGNNSEIRTFKGDYGCDIAFIKISFSSPLAELAEVRVGGVPQ